ncbi:hypothetical protein LY90DRAFT_505139 [Neocallimastix californiae]|uniref:Uncharacterized protein n=1 Tax=Neocallimastix californiae TaxID=1754190 RepID=A0A1Y2DZA1_9FUNG|nr:hypothetical protein LY90DRAFT_505139 [Neocallimastix californiae]|eukprot:ORY64593.1 hypothetical protein LY90DRAFT_505139 [Neocallimastix californiae]
MEKVYFVISKDNVNILNILINNHLNIYEKDKNGDSVLLYAYKFFHNNIIHYLEHQKPDFINLTNNNKKDCDYDINSLIQVALKFRSVHAIQNLIKKEGKRNYNLLSSLVHGGYNVDFWDFECSHTPLTLAVENNESKIVTLLFKVNANIENIDSRMYLVTNLIEKGNYQMLSILIENKLDLERLVNALQKGLFNYNN